MESGVRKLIYENEKLKKLLAEKELENALLSDALKKGQSDIPLLIKERRKGMRVLEGDMAAYLYESITGLFKAK